MFLVLIFMWTYTISLFEQTNMHELLQEVLKAMNSGLLLVVFRTMACCKVYVVEMSTHDDLASTI